MVQKDCSGELWLNYAEIEWHWAGIESKPPSGDWCVEGLRSPDYGCTHCVLHFTRAHIHTTKTTAYIYIYMYITIHMHTHIIHTSHRLIVRVYICLHTVVICHCLLCCILLCCLLSIVIEYASILPFSSVLPTYFRWRLATEHREREGEICGDMYIYIHTHRHRLYGRIWFQDVSTIYPFPQCFSTFRVPQTIGFRGRKRA